MPSNWLGSALLSPLTKAFSNSSLRALALSWMTAASRVLDVGACLLEVAVDVGVAAEDSEGGGDLVEGDRGGSPNVAGGVPLGGADLVFAVVGEGVSNQLVEGKELEDGRFVDDLFNDAGFENVVGELGCFG